MLPFRFLLFDSIPGQFVDCFIIPYGNDDDPHDVVFPDDAVNDPQAQLEQLDFQVAGQVGAAVTAQGLSQSAFRVGQGIGGDLLNGLQHLKLLRAVQRPKVFQGGGDILDLPTTHSMSTSMSARASG